MTSKDWLIFIMASVCMSGLIIGCLMMFVTRMYINRSKRRKRLIELGYGTNNEWYRGGKVDLVLANFFMSNMVGASYAMRWRYKRGKSIPVSAGTPNLHNDLNFLKVLEEFPFFVRWELSKYAIIIGSFAIGGIAIGLDKGWW